MDADDRPGSEIRKEYRDVVEYLIDVHGWRYDATGSGYPQLKPPDKTKRQIPVPKTPSRDPRAFHNWVAQIRRAGGVWPPTRR